LDDGYGAPCASEADAGRALSHSPPDVMLGNRDYGSDGDVYVSGSEDDGYDHPTQGDNGDCSYCGSGGVCTLTNDGVTRTDDGEENPHNLRHLHVSGSGGERNDNVRGDVTWHCACKAGYSGSGERGACKPVECPTKSRGRNVPSGCFCNPGFSGVVVKTEEAPFYDESCERVNCPLNSEGTMPFCKCKSGYHGRIGASMQYPFFEGSCQENVCYCQDGVAAKGGSWYVDDRFDASPVIQVGPPSKYEESFCGDSGAEDCSSCDPHFRLEFDEVTRRGSCLPCPVGTYNLASQFHPLHQQGLYAESGNYYSVEEEGYSNEETNDATTCKTDRDDACSVKAKEECWAEFACKWFAEEDTCSLQDPCVRKAKTACRSASHCNWQMENGRCFEAEQPIGDKCERKNMHGCISDYYCKWSQERIVGDRAVKEGCALHPCRNRNKGACTDTADARCAWNSRYTRCDTRFNGWQGEGSKNFEWVDGEMRGVSNP